MKSVSKKAVIITVCVVGVLLMAVLLWVGYKVYCSWEQNNILESMTPEERCAQRFENLVRQYTEEKGLIHQVSFGDPVSNEREYHYSFYYCLDGFDVEVTLRSFSANNEDIFIRVMCDENEGAGKVIEHINDIQQWFTGKAFSHELLSKKYDDSKKNENNPNYGKSDLDFMGNYTVYYESDLFGYSESWAHANANSVMYSFSGKLAKR